LQIGSPRLIYFPFRSAERRVLIDTPVLTPISYIKGPEVIHHHLREGPVGIDSQTGSGLGERVYGVDLTTLQIEVGSVVSGQST